MFEALQFFLRKRLFGRWRLRRGLPRLPPLTDHVGELAYYGLLLRSAMPAQERLAVKRVFDMGCRNWSYVAALAHAFPNAELVGIEVDGYRRYWNLFRRADYARAYAAQLTPPARVILGDGRQQPLAPAPAGITLYCLLFPFLHPNPCRRWGLPTYFADYPALLRHTMQLSSGAETRWLAVHQGSWEAEVARPMYRQLGLSLRAIRLTPDAWIGQWSSPYDNYLFYGRRR